MARLKTAAAKTTQPPESAAAATLVDAPASRCTTCGSTRRTDYHHTQSLPIDGMLPDGTIYASITLRRTECLDCLQARVDRTYELPPQESSACRNSSAESEPPAAESA